MPIPKIIEEIKAQEAQSKARLASVPKNSFEGIAAREEDDIRTKRINFFYSRMTQEMSPERLPALEEFAKRVMGEAYNSVVKTIRMVTKTTDEYLAPKMGGKLLFYVNADGYGEICSIVGEEIAEKAWEEAKSYIPPDYDPTPIHPLEKEVAALKERLPELEPDEEKRAKLSADLDEINEMITQTNPAYSETQTDKNASYGHVLIANDYAKETELLKSGALGIIGDHMTYSETNKGYRFHDYQGDMQLKNAMQSLEVKYAPDYRAKIIAILKRMDELELVPENATGAEESTKVYGFRKLVDAQTALKEAIKKGDVQNLSQLKEEYVRQTQNMRELYAMVEDAIPDDNRCVANNVDNMRSAFIPAEFKKSVATNSNLNSLWITLSFIKQSGASIEDFVDRPTAHLRAVITKQIESKAPETQFAGMSIGQVLISDAYKTDIDYSINWLGTLRATDALCGGDPENRHYNVMVTRVLESEISIAVPPTRTYIDVASYSPHDTLANIFLVNDEDREYAKMPSDRNKSADGFTEYPPFDPVQYLAEHDIDYKAMADRMGNALKEFSDGILAQPDNGKRLSYDVVKLMGSVQVATARALLLKNPHPSEPGVKELTEFLENPVKALEKYGVGKDVINSLNARMNEPKGDPVSEIEQKSLNLEKLFSDKEKELKGFTSSEKAYNQKADTILKEAEKISSRVAKEKDPEKAEKLQIESVKKMNELKELQRQECERLESAFKGGKITAYYLKNRTDKISSLDHNKSTAMFEAEAFPSKDDYIKSTGLEELTSEEKKGLYESAKMRAQDEKQRFIKRRILEDKKFLPKEEISAEGVAKGINFAPVDTQELEMPKPVVSDSSSVADDREPIVVTEAMDENQPKSEAQVDEVKPPVSDKLP